MLKNEKKESWNLYRRETKNIWNENVLKVPVIHVRTAYKDCSIPLHGMMKAEHEGHDLINLGTQQNLGIS
jgi:hypothetical protein